MEGKITPAQVVNQLTQESLDKAGEMLDKMSAGIKAATDARLNELLEPFVFIREEIIPRVNKNYATLLKDLEAKAQEFDLMIEQFDHMLIVWEKAEGHIEIESISFVSLANSDQVISFCSMSELKTFIERWKSEPEFPKQHLGRNPYKLKIAIKDHN